MIVETILESIWFMMPAYAAVIVPVFAAKLPIPAIPVSEKLFGKNKTIRGFFFGVIAALIVVHYQSILYIYSFVMRALSIVYYDQINAPLLGFLLGFGALFGDLIKSYFKRRMKIREGEDWIPFDNIDYVIGSLAFASFIFIPDLEHILIIIIVSGLLHYVFVALAYKLRIRTR